MKYIFLTLILLGLMPSFAKAQFSDYIVTKDNNLEIILRLRNKSGAFDDENAFWLFKNKQNQSIVIKNLGIAASIQGKNGAYSGNTTLHGLFFIPSIKYKGVSFGQGVKTVEIKPDETIIAFAESLSSNLQSSNEGIGKLKIDLKITYELNGQDIILEKKGFECKVETIGIKEIPDSTLLSEVKKMVRQYKSEDNHDLFQKVYYQKSYIIDQIDKRDIINHIKDKKTSIIRSTLLEYMNMGAKSDKEELNTYFQSLIEKEDSQIFRDLYDYWDNDLLPTLFKVYSNSDEKFYCYSSLIKRLKQQDSVQIDSSQKVLMYNVIKSKEREVFKSAKSKKDTLGRFKHWMLLIESTECPLWIPYLEKFLIDDSKVLDLVINEVDVQCQGNGMATISGFINPEPQTVRELAIDQIFKLQNSSYDREINKIRFELYKKDFRKKNPRKPIPQDIGFRMHYGDEEFDKYLNEAKQILWEREMKILKIPNQ